MRKLMLAALLASAAALGSTPALAESPDNMLVIGTQISGIRTLDPAANNARTVSELMSNAYDNLVMTKPESIDKLEPMLATSWEVSGDGKTITLQLRDDATFSSGNPVTAEDAAWSIQRIIKMGQVGSTDLALWGYTPENVDGLVRAEGGHTLVMELPTEVNTDLVLFSLAGSSVGIIDKKTALEHEANGDFGSAWLAANTAGSGPFVLTQLRPNNMAMFDAREDYWGGAPAMKRVAVMHIPESGNLRLQMEKGDVDVGHYVASGDLEAMEKNPEMVIDKVPGLGFYYVALNTQDPDLAKPEVRRAFQHAFNWEAIQDNIMKYLGSPWQSMVPNGMTGAPESATDRYDYDPEEAKQILADAGYPDGITKVLNPSSDATLPVAEALQASARDAGITLNLVPGEFTPAFRERKFEVLVGNSGTRLPDPFGVATQYAFNPDNSDEARLGSYYLWRVSQQNEELNKLVDQSMRERDNEKRAPIFAEMDKIYQEMVPGLVIFFQRTDPYVMRSNVHGYAGHTTWSTRWHDVTKE